MKKRFEFYHDKDAQYVLDNDFLYPSYMVAAAHHYFEGK